MKYRKRRSRTRASRWPAWVVLFLIISFALGGSYGVKLHKWSGEWQIEASQERVFRALLDTPSYQNWWPGLVVKPRESGPVRAGSAMDIEVKLLGRLPFRFVVTVTDIEQNRWIRFRAGGGLDGAIEWTLSPSDTGTNVRFYLLARATNPLSNLTGLMAESLIIEGRDKLMEEGREGLRRVSKRD